MKILENFKPKVSVLVVNHNNAKFIPQCINSIINQTYSNYEIIFFDDNSKAESLKIIKELHWKKNFILIHNKLTFTLILICKMVTLVEIFN